jgi:hypothetical protein
MTSTNLSSQAPGPSLLAIAALLTLTLGAALAQCPDWPSGCPTMDDLAVTDSDNSPLAVPPGHTQEDICPVGINENKELQLDITESFVRVESGLLYLRSFYNTNSAASTTEQFWFFDVDHDPVTGGHDSVWPTYIDTGPSSGQGPTFCNTSTCTTPVLPEVHASGFEYYIHSFGQASTDFAIFRWDSSTATWEEEPKPLGAINLQSAEDNPANAYTGNNGYRGIAYLPTAAIGVGDDYYRMYARTYSCQECCGDGGGGEDYVLPPTMRPCWTQLCGDCDDSGFVDILDSFRAAHWDAGLTPPPTDIEYSNCNVLGTLGPSYYTDISILDALQIARYVVGLVDLTCCACCVPELMGM